jgi:hypothetical protein
MEEAFRESEKKVIKQQEANFKLQDENRYFRSQMAAKQPQAQALIRSA